MRDIEGMPRVARCGRAGRVVWLDDGRWLKDWGTGQAGAAVNDKR